MRSGMNENSSTKAEIIVTTTENTKAITTETLIENTSGMLLIFFNKYDLKMISAFIHLKIIIIFMPLESIENDTEGENKNAVTASTIGTPVIIETTSEQIKETTTGYNN